MLCLCPCKCVHTSLLVEVTHPTSDNTLQHGRHASHSTTWHLADRHNTPQHTRMAPKHALSHTIRRLTGSSLCLSNAIVRSSLTHNNPQPLCSDVRCNLRCQIDDNGATAVRMPHKQQHRQSPPASMQQQEDCKQCTAVVIADIQMCRPAQLALSTLKNSTPRNTSSLLGRHVLSHQQQLPSLEPQSKATPAGQPAGAQAVVLSGSIAVRTP